MKKNLAKIISVFLSLITVFSVGLGCGSDPVPDTATDIQISYWESGFGKTYISQIIKRFGEIHPEYNVILESSSAVNADTLYLDPTSNSIDLYITAFGSKNAYADLIEPLDDLLNEKPDGENGLTIGEKFGDIVAKNRADDGKVYGLPAITGSLTGMIYNLNMFKDKDGNYYDVPNTTDEFVKLALTIKADGKTPFVYYKDYWYYIFESWVAQYEGVDNYYDIRNGFYTDSNGEKHANDVRIITESQGRYEAYKVMSELLGPKGYAYSNTNNFNHTQAQTYFLSEKAVMQPNGSWVENEMKNLENDAEVRMMKTPVLSAFGKKIGISTDRHLSIIVDYVDGKTLTAAEAEIVNSYSDDIINQVREARSIHYIGALMDVVIPIYSNAKDAAKEFLKFYYSDEAMLIAQNSLNTFVGLKYSVEPELDKSAWSDFMKSVDDIRKDANIISCSLNTTLFYNNALVQLYDGSGASSHHIIDCLTYRDDGRTESAEAYWTKEKNMWNERWSSLLKNAGLQ